MKIIVDSREQTPWDFKPYGAEVITSKLDIGDYSLPGLERLVAVERKSLSDLIGSITTGRDRFAREMARGMALERFCVVVEDSWVNLAGGAYKSRMSESSAISSCIAFFVRYGVPFFFAGSREGAEYYTYTFLRLFLEEQSKRQKIAEKGQK